MSGPGSLFVPYLGKKTCIYAFKTNSYCTCCDSTYICKDTGHYGEYAYCTLVLETNLLQLTS